jgi:RNA polymerase sigma-70 factor (ECF subfamily)
MFSSYDGPDREGDLWEAASRRILHLLALGLRRKNLLSQRSGGRPLSSRPVRRTSCSSGTPWESRALRRRPSWGRPSSLRTREAPLPASAIPEPASDSGKKARRKRRSTSAWLLSGYPSDSPRMTLPSCRFPRPSEAETPWPVSGPGRASVCGSLRSSWSTRVRLRAETDGRPGLAEDVSQEVFLALLRHGGTYDPARPFIPWLLTLVRNKAIDFFRRSGNKPEAHGPGPPGGSAVETPRDASIGEPIERALAELPAAFREASGFRTGWESPMSRSRRFLGCDVGTVGSRVSRGRKLLRDYFSRHADVL